jgi:hypothetical protein
MSWWRSTVIGIAALAWGVPGVVATDEVERGQLPARRDAAHPSTPARADVDMGIAQSALKIAKMVRAVVFQISLVEDVSRGRTEAPERVIAGPFTIEAKFDLEPADSAEYEALLRNLPTDCRCAPRIRVLAVRFFADSGAHPSPVWD